MIDRLGRIKEGYAHVRVPKESFPNTDTILVSKARAAIQNYKVIYGDFPARVGIEYERLREMKRVPYLILMERKEPAARITEESPVGLVLPSFRRVTIPFEAVAGKKVRSDEVYLPHPRDGEKIVSGTVIVELLRRIAERDFRLDPSAARYFWRRSERIPWSRLQETI